MEIGSSLDARVEVRTSAARRTQQADHHHQPTCSGFEGTELGPEPTRRRIWPSVWCRELGALDVLAAAVDAASTLRRRVDGRGRVDGARVDSVPRWLQVAAVGGGGSSAVPVA